MSLKSQKKEYSYVLNRHKCEETIVQNITIRLSEIMVGVILARRLFFR